MKVKVTEYKNYLVIKTLEPEKDDDFLPVTEPNLIGSILTNTGKHLGISKEALKFMKKLRVVGDDLGEIDAFKTYDGKSCFGWLGNLSRLVGPDAVLPNTGFENIDFIEIPNEPPKEAIEEIDKREKE